LSIVRQWFTPVFISLFLLLSFETQALVTGLRFTQVTLTGIKSPSSEAQTGGGTYSGTLIPDFIVGHALNPEWMLYGGLDLYVNSSTGALDFWGLRGGARYYFKGEAAGFAEVSDVLESTTMSVWAYYVAAELKRYNYYLGSNPEQVKDYEQNGSFFNQNFALGLDYRFSTLWAVNAEINYTFAAFAASDDRIQAKGLIMALGVMRFW